jgi:hypothetical protein
MDRHTRTDLRYRLSLVAVLMALLAATIGLAAPRSVVMADGDPTPTPTRTGGEGGGGSPGRG